jgi:cell division septation protein DedD
MESDDDEKRRVMTPPESWGGGPSQKKDDASLANDDSWLSEDDDIPADEGDEQSDVEASDTAPVADTDPAPPSIDSDPEDDWLGAAPETTATPQESDAEAVAMDDAATASEAETPNTASAEYFDGGMNPGVDTNISENDALEDSPTAAVSAAAAKLVDEELTQEASTMAADTHSSEALLTDHQAATSTAGKPEQKVPTWAFAALAVALLLIIAGGWGFFNERGKLEAEVASLEAELQALRRAKDGDLSVEEEELLIADNQSLRVQLATQREQYAAMTSELDQLQAMIDQAQAIAPATTTSTEAASSSAPARETVGNESGQAAATPSTATAKTAKTTPSVVATGGVWFVNVASYSRRDIAQEWADKLAGEIDNVSLQEVTVNGKPLFRVRAVGYPDKTAAQQAAKQLEQQYGIGPLWVGKDSADAVKTSGNTDDSAPASMAASDKGAGVDTQIVPQAMASNSDDGGWFIFVDTYGRGVDADARARQIREAGYNAKVAVESRAGELFYRVQVVGIESQEQGEETIKALAQLGDLPNLQLRRY